MADPLDDAVFGDVKIGFWDQQVPQDVVMRFTVAKKVDDYVEFSYEQWERLCAVLCRLGQHVPEKDRAEKLVSWLEGEAEQYDRFPRELGEQVQNQTAVLNISLPAIKDSYTSHRFNQEFLETLQKALHRWEASDVRNSYSLEVEKHKQPQGWTAVSDTPLLIDEMQESFYFNPTNYKMIGDPISPTVNLLPTTVAAEEKQADPTQEMYWGPRPFGSGTMDFCEHCGLTPPFGYRNGDGTRYVCKEGYEKKKR